MDRRTAQDLLLKDHTHDALIERPELYSIEGDIYQWMFETRNYWNERIPRLMDYYRKEGEELQKEDREYMGLNIIQRRIFAEKHISAIAVSVDMHGAIFMVGWLNSGDIC